MNTVFANKWTSILLATVALLFSPTLFLPRKYSQPAQTLWAKGLVWLLRTIVGIRMEIRGLQHIAAGPVLVASKHQSAWETVIFHLLLDDPVMIIKRELFWIPPGLATCPCQTPLALRMCAAYSTRHPKDLDLLA